LRALLVTSSTTRFTPGTSSAMRVEIQASSSQGNRVQSAVMASSLDTSRSTTGCLSRLLRGDPSAAPEPLTRPRLEPQSITATAEKR
jgi:hypothetical protein